LTGAREQGKGFLASGIDPGDRKGYKNYYIDLLQKAALQEVLKLNGDEVVLDFGCGSGRFSYWIAPKVKKGSGLEITREMIDLAEKKTGPLRMSNSWVYGRYPFSLFSLSL